MKMNPIFRSITNHRVPPPLWRARLQIMESLAPLFKRAKDEKLWFWNKSLNLWFAPSKLVEQIKSGNYIWGPDHWTLRSPLEYGQPAA